MSDEVSVLYLDREARRSPALDPREPSFRDLGLDEICDAIAQQAAGHDVTEVLYQPLGDPNAIVYRHEVFADLASGAVRAALSRFIEADVVASSARRREELAHDDGGYNHFHRARFFLNEAARYVEVVTQLDEDLAELDLRSRGLRGARDAVRGVVSSSRFVQLREDVNRVREALSALSYCVWIKGQRLTVAAFDDEDDLGAEIVRTFARFSSEATRSYLPTYRFLDTYAAIGVLDLVAHVFPEPFAELDAFCATYADLVDPVIATLDRELPFYLAVTAVIEPLAATGCAFCFPRLTEGEEHVRATFDLALALRRSGHDIVPASYDLDAHERIVVVTGPNDGGKTTFARAVGQLHYLARLGVAVAGESASLRLCDHIFTHFERPEQPIEALGKLASELQRLHDAVERATAQSLFVLNEPFNSTSAADALELSQRLVGIIRARGSLAVIVTFLDELAAGDDVVSMVAQVDPRDPAVRTHRIERAPAQGRAYARALAEHYGLTLDQLTTLFAGR